MSLNAAVELSKNRAILFGLGFVSGLALWQLSEHWDNPALPPWLLLALLSFIGSYASVALALCGPVSVLRALGGALVLSVPFTALTSLAGRRYELATEILDQPVPISVSILVLLLATPFLIVGLQNRPVWRSYTALFETAWALTIRYLSAWVFVGLFWVLMFLSDALLSLVEVKVIDWITDEEWLVFGLTGGVLGLAMAVVFELRAAVSPFLLLRLLRLLVLPVLAVVAVFLIAIPLRGLSQLFGDFSAAATLMSVATVMITLIAVVLERDDARMRESVTISISTQYLAVLLPFVTGLAAWSIWLRVFDYGWTPDRVLAACFSAVLLGYGVLYPLAVLRRTGWEERIRRINVWLALVTIAISAALLTPLLNPDKIAASSQVQRYQDGRLSLDKFPIAQLEHDWGRAGQEALKALEDSPESQSPELIRRLQDFRSADNRWAFERGVTSEKLEGLKAELVEKLPIFPEGETLNIEDLEGLEQYDLSLWLTGCDLPVSNGRPGCVLIIDQFDLNSDRQGMLLYRNSHYALTVKTRFLTFATQGLALSKEAQVLAGQARPRLNTMAIEQIFSGEYSVGPSSLRALHVGGREITTRP
ncbi:DUF4153 domain-containing protein [Parasedimentitalea maritima]|uniref:DUF4153 domain-containing protein n=1 Tax=Parasedimentitalea maritima TaxID=2578117 RepID=A0ABY2UYE2_9RHOB|nr:DUF4153 domain-containing protein [Zongyanglinia marina]TLP67897.1 DUF4153 domain-containing protein [Zongyanglinia marina]